MSMPIQDSDYAEDEILTEEIARAFLEDPDSQSLDRYLVMEDAAAEVLRKKQGYLNLNGIVSLSDTSASALSKQEGVLELLALRTLIDSPGHIALANKLSTQDEGYLHLDSLISLPDSTMEVLSKHRGGLILSSLTTLSDAAAESISQKVFSGRSFYLEGLKSISENAAYCLWNTADVAILPQP